jgi:hypothetical protein
VTQLFLAHPVSISYKSEASERLRFRTQLRISRQSSDPFPQPPIFWFVVFLKYSFNQPLATFQLFSSKNKRIFRLPQQDCYFNLLKALSPSLKNTWFLQLSPESILHVHVTYTWCFQLLYLPEYACVASKKIADKTYFKPSCLSVVFYLCRFRCCFTDTCIIISVMYVKIKLFSLIMKKY